MAYGSLAPTGTGLSLAGLALGQVWLVAAALLLPLLGAVLVRCTFRRGKNPGEV